MALLVRLLLIVLLIGSGWYLWSGIKNDRRKKIYGDLLDLASASAVEAMRALIQSRSLQNLQDSWLFYAHYFSLRLAWFNLEACAAAEHVTFNKDIIWKSAINRHLEKLMLESGGNADVFLKFSDFDGQADFFIKRVVATGGGFAIRNCQGQLAEMLKKHLFILSGGNGESWSADFEETVVAVIENCGDKIQQGIKANKKNLK